MNLQENIYRIRKLMNLHENEDYSNSVTSVCLIQNDNDDVLILQRGSTAPWMPDKWSLVGGGVEEGETPMDGAKREVQEEIGVDIYDLTYFDEYYDTNVGKLIYYYTKLPIGSKVKLNWENQDYAWVNLKTINGFDFVPNVKNIIIKFLSK